MSVSLTKAVVVAFEGAAFAEVTGGVGFLQGGQTDRGGAPQLDVTGEMSPVSFTGQGFVR